METTTSFGISEYEDTIVTMEKRVDDVIARSKNGLLWFLEYPEIYTAGTSAKAQDLINPRFPVHQTKRGGQWTYHGKGQRIMYAIYDLRGKPLDLRKYVQDVEAVIIAALEKAKIKTCTRKGRIGIWTKSNDEKIASIGIRVRGGIAYYGAAINISPNLEHFSGIIPCGIKDRGVTSIEKELSKTELPVNFLDKHLMQTWESVFGDKLAPAKQS